MDARSILICVTGLTVSACNDPEAVSSALGDLDEIIERDGAADVQTGMCSNKRIVGRLPANQSDCPVRAKWLATNVLEGGTTFLADNHVDLHGAGGRFCAYQWNATGSPTQTQVDTLMGTMLGSVRDCMAIKPMSDALPVDPVPTPLNETLAPVLQSLFWDRAGGVTSDELESGGLSTEDIRRPVRVSMVDTVPFAFNGWVTYDHGEMLKRMVLDLACPATDPPDCAVSVVRILGMPRTAPLVVDPVHGGIGATLSDAGAALMEAHRRWQLSGEDGLHIVNLSLGWIDDAFNNPGENMNANAEAIHFALQHLACHGEIVVAATGNGDPLTCSEEAVYPARWQSEPAPNAVQCAALLNVTVANLPVPIPATPRPLLYAAAGLTLEDELLPSTPDLSVSPLVAIADHAVGGDTDLATIMTGTSVAAAVTTAAAAMAGSYNPDGDGWDAMQAVYDGAVPMPAADMEITLTMPGVHPEVRRVSMCGALTAACEAWGSCGLDSECSSAYELDMSALDFDYGGTDWSQNASYGATDDCLLSESICGADTEAMAPGNAQQAANACATNYLDPLVAFVKPQPPKPPCPACTLSTEEQKLYFTLSNDFAAANVENVTIHITDGDGAEFSVNLGDPPVDSLSTQRLLINDRLFYPGIVVKKAVVDVKISGVKEFNDVLVPGLVPG